MLTPSQNKQCCEDGSQMSRLILCKIPIQVSHLFPEHLLHHRHVCQIVYSAPQKPLQHGDPLFINKHASREVESSLGACYKQLTCPESAASDGPTLPLERGGKGRHLGEVTSHSWGGSYLFKWYNRYLCVGAGLSVSNPLFYHGCL